jgi:uncharacterized protein (DUF4415 family)
MIDETDWAKIAAMSEADIERAAAEDQDASLTIVGYWKDARVEWPQTMEPVMLQFDRDVLAWFRRQGRAIRRLSMRCFAPSSRRKSARRPAPRHVQNVRTSDAVLALNRDCAPLATICGARS